MNLVDKPELQQQPCPRSCFPTCVAMVTGTPVSRILERVKQLGIDIRGVGMFERECEFLLTELGIGSYTSLVTVGHGLTPGTYIANVVSKNTTNTTHCIVVICHEDCTISVLDPQSGMAGRKAYEPSEIPPALSFLRLDDFSDIKAGAA